MSPELLEAPEPPAPAPRRTRRGPAENPETTRFLQRMGAVTVGVSLPRTWMGGHALAPGSPVRVRMLPDGSVLVRDMRSSEELIQAVLDVERGAPSEHLFRRLIAAYVRGASEFVLREPGGISVETRQVARTFARRTVQPEIASEEEEELVLRDVSRGAQIAIPQLLHRMFQIVLQLHREAGRSWLGGALRPEEPFDVRDDEVDRHAWLIERVLTIRIREGPAGDEPTTIREEPVETLLLARALERAADHAVTIAELGPRLRQEGISPAILRALTGYHEQVLETLAAAFDVVEHPSAERGNEVIDTEEALRSTNSTLSDRLLARGNSSHLSPTAITSIGLLLQSIARTAAYAADIAQVGLDRAVRLGPVPAASVPSSSSIERKRGGIREK